METLYAYDTASYLFNQLGCLLQTQLLCKKPTQTLHIATFYIGREARTELGAERGVKSTMVSNMVQVHRRGGRGSEIFTWYTYCTYQNYRKV